LPARITFISHGATSALRRAAFPLDEPVIAEELEKIAAIGWTAPRAQQVLCGPEQRARQTAEALGLQPDWSIEIGDVDFGSWVGRELEDIQTADPSGLAAWFTDMEVSPHGGESFVQLIARVGNWMQRQTVAGHTVAVTHPSVVRAAILCCLAAPHNSFWRVDIAPLSITDLRFNGKVWTVRSIGCPLDRSFGTQRMSESVTDC
jgi:broad specificity phosphatase PhoE